MSLSTPPHPPTPPPPPPPHPHPTTTIPLFPIHSPSPPTQPHPLNPNPNPNPNNLLYPLPTYPTKPNFTNNNVFGYHNRAPTYNGSGQLGPGFGVLGPSSATPVVKGLPIPKMGSSQTPIMDNDRFKETRDRSRDDSFLIVRDRKVRVSEDSSLYALCRSWLRNGLPEQTEPQYNDIVKSLPRPLPLAPQDSQSSGKKEEKEENEEEDGGFVEHLSHQDLLQKHIKRAKRVRSRLREERLRRIARYKTRLSLLLPAIVEQHHRNESTTGNGNTS